MAEAAAAGRRQPGSCPYRRSYTPPGFCIYISTAVCLCWSGNVRLRSSTGINGLSGTGQLSPHRPCPNRQRVQPRDGQAPSRFCASSSSETSQLKAILQEAFTSRESDLFINKSAVLLNA